MEQIEEMERFKRRVNSSLRIIQPVVRQDKRIVELVKLLARIAAERDYNRAIQRKNESTQEIAPHD